MQTAATDTYRDHEGLIFVIVKNFVARWGGDFEEFLGEARLVYWELYSGKGRAYIRTKPERSFASSVTFYIYHILLELRRKQLYRGAHFKEYAKDPQTFDTRTDARWSTWLVDLTDEMSEDAIEVIKICLDQRGAVMRDQGPKNIKNITNKEFLWGYLRNIGWKCVQIEQAFEEITEALRA